MDVDHVAVPAEGEDVVFASMFQRLVYTSYAADKRKPIVAVLTAVKEHLSEAEKASTPVTYLTTLLAALQDSVERKSVAMVSPQMSILKMLFPQLSSSVLAHVGESVLAVLGKVLKKFSGESMVVRNVIAIAGMYLQDQQDAAFRRPRTFHMFQAILQFCVDKRPKVRKAAQGEVVNTLRPHREAVVAVHGTKADLQSRTILKCAPEVATFIDRNLKALQDAVDAKAKDITPHSAVYSMNLFSKIAAFVPEKVIRGLSMSTIDCASSKMPSLAREAALKIMLDIVPAKNVLFLDTTLEIILHKLETVQPARSEGNLAILFTRVYGHAALARVNIDREGADKDEATGALVGGHVSATGARVLENCIPRMMTNFLARDSTLSSVTLRALAVILKKTIDPKMVEAAVAYKGDHNTMTPVEERGAVLRKIVQSLEDALQFRYSHCWADVLQAIGVVADLLDTEALPLLESIVRHLGQMHVSAPEEKFSQDDDEPKKQKISLRKQIEFCLSAICKAAGPIALLTLLPLNLFSKDPATPPRPWLLDVMKGKIQGSSLEYFATNMIPLADSLHEKANKMWADGLHPQSRSFDSLWLKIWGLLPGFCHYPTDLKTSFPVIGPVLARQMSSHPQLVVPIGLSFQVLVHHARVAVEGYYSPNQELEVSEFHEKRDNLDGDKDDEELAVRTPEDYKREHMARLARHIPSLEEASKILSKKEGTRNMKVMNKYTSKLLPVVFSVVRDIHRAREGVLKVGRADIRFVATASETLESALRTATALVLVSDASLVGKVFNKIVKSLVEAQTAALTGVAGDAAATERLITAKIQTDLALAVAVRLDEAVIPFLFQTIHPQLDTPRQNLQKKAFRVLSTILAMYPQWTKDNLSVLVGVVTQSPKNASANATRSRMLCIALISAHLEPETLSVVMELLTQVILGTKEHNFKARDQAYRSLIALAERFKALEGKTAILIPDTPPVRLSLPEFVKMAAAGLAGRSSRMVSATMLALSRLLFEFNSELSDDFVMEMTGAVVELFRTKSDEVARSLFSFMKVLITVGPACVFNGETMPAFLGGIGSWSIGRSRFRQSVTVLLDRLVQRVGIDMVSAHAPESLELQVKKMAYRIKRKRRVKEEKERRNPNKRGAQRHTAESTAAFENFLGDDSEVMDFGGDGNAAPGLQNEVMDLLTPGGGSSLLRQARDSRKEEKSSRKSKRELKDGISSGADGKMVIEDPEGISGAWENMSRQEKKVAQTALARGESMDSVVKRMVKEKRGETDLMKLADEVIDIRAGDRGKNKARRQAQARGGGMDDIDLGEDGDATMGGRNNSLTRLAKAKADIRKKRSKIQGVQSGKKFSAKHAGGDVHSNGMSPYAYLPLSRKIINKRRSKDVEGQVKSVVHIGKDSSKRGKKDKSTRRRR